MNVENPNYCATIVELNKFVAIEKADNIKSAIIFSNSVIVGNYVAEGTKGIFFPLECQLNDIFLSEHNLFRDKDKNKDTEQAGFFDKNGRVRAVKLRGAKSEGYFIPLDSLSEKFDEIKTYSVGTDFDKIANIWICRKFELPVKNTGTKSRQGVSAKKDRIIPEQFHFHIDTLNARKHIGFIDPNSLISITNKAHGTSIVLANVLVHRKLAWYEKLLLKLGIKIDTLEYGNVYSSRKVIKNGELNPTAGVGFYGSDIWGVHNALVKDLIPKGISLYGEVVGYAEDKPIQPGYTYGHDVGKSSLYIYRVTQTNKDGQVYEMTWNQIKEFCKHYGLAHVEEFYYGLAKDLYPDLDTAIHWHDNFLERLQADFNLEKDDKDNKGMPAEGICIRKDELLDCTTLKLKSFQFLQYETQMLDNGTEIAS
jgi:hypothetical protein